MAIRHRTRRNSCKRRRGAVAMHMLVLLGTIMVIFMGFAFDLGRLYLNRSELQTMASAMAIAAAQQLIGTEISTAYAGSAARAAVSVANGGGNRYDFGGIVLGEGTTLLSSEVPEPRFYESMSGATGEGDGGLGQEVSGGAARFARVEVRADAPLVFFGLLFIAADRKVPLATAAVAGVSAPVCSACGTEPIAVAAPNTEDSTDFGFVRGTRYTFHYQCNGQPLPQPLGTAASRLPYLLLNRLDAESSNFATEDSQLFRNGNNGVPPSNNLNQACITIGQPVQIWATATPRLCSQTAPNPTVQQFLCGLNNRFDNSLSDPACAAITDSATLSSAPPVDNDLNDFDDFTSYTGRGRRIITIAVVDLLSSTADMAVLGFRQFLVMPNPGVTTLSPADGPGRFAAIYIGYPAPLRQGRFGSCGVSSGPGKVVLHR